VMLIETMAQTCGTIVMALKKYERLPLLVGVKNAKLRRFVEPNTLILGRGVLEHDGSGYAVAKGELRAKVEGKEVRIANAELTYTLIPWPNEDLKSFMLDLIANLQNAAHGSADARLSYPTEPEVSG
jgi:3-hydroxyacyl-[acyl-carrier-protein] dehydratase